MRATPPGHRSFISLTSDLGHKLGHSSHLGGPFLYGFGFTITTRPSIHPNLVNKRQLLSGLKGLAFSHDQTLLFPVQEPHLLRSRMKEETKTESSQRKQPKKNVSLPSARSRCVGCMAADHLILSMEPSPVYFGSLVMLTPLNFPVPILQGDPQLGGGAPIPWVHKATLFGISLRASTYPESAAVQYTLRLPFGAKLGKAGPGLGEQRTPTNVGLCVHPTGPILLPWHVLGSPGSSDSLYTLC